MKYRILGKTGEKVSTLGVGAMRLPLLEKAAFDSMMEGRSPIDEKQAIRIIRHALDHGVNYVDTAYPYHGGRSEDLVGRALRDGYRAKTLLATKLPQWFVKKESDIEELLDTQLKRLETDCIDCYLIHALGRRSWERLQNLDLAAAFDKVKRKGKIRYLGFSFHDSYEVFTEILPALVERLGVEFCLLQYNYMDQNIQAGIRGIKLAAQMGLGVQVMEPVRGGSLVYGLPASAQALMREAGDTPVAWALRWVWERPEVAVALSGMSTLAQACENVRIAERSEERLTASELAMIEKIRLELEERVKIRCTNCGYCLPCPNGVDIPGSFAHYNEAFIYDNIPEARGKYNFNVKSKASACTECGACEEHCPQQIPIREALQTVVALMEK